MNLTKCTLIIGLFLSFNLVSWAQNIEFNDSNFKALLVSNEEINSNGDDEIQISEAEVYSGKLEIVGVAISDLTGIEYFTSIKELVYYSSISTVLDVSRNTALERLTSGNLINLKLGNNEALSYVFTDLNNFTSLVIENEHLDTLLCWHNINQMTIDVNAATSLEFLDLNDNLLTSLDVSNLKNLKTLNCDVNSIYSLDLSNNKLLTQLDIFLNPIAEIDVSKNILLKRLRCASTQITTLDVSKNTNLEKLFCDFTQLTSLDLSKNENLVWLDCYNSNLKTLNVKNGNNSNVQYFDMRENLNLECIQVDNKDYSISNWFNVPFNSTFDENCDSTVGLAAGNSSIQYNAYPNPVNDRLFIDLGETYNEIKIEIYDVSAQLKKIDNFSLKSSVQVELDITPGIYFVKMITESSNYSFKILKE